MTKEKLYTTGMLGRMFNLKRVTVTRRCSGVRGKDRWGAEKIDTIDGKKVYVVPESKLYLWKVGDGKTYRGPKPILRQEEDKTGNENDNIV